MLEGEDNKVISKKIKKGIDSKNKTLLQKTERENDTTQCKVNYFVGKIFISGYFPYTECIYHDHSNRLSLKVNKCVT